MSMDLTWLNELIVTLTPYIVIGVVIYSVFLMIKQLMPEKENKELQVRSMSERLYKMMCSAASLDTLKQRAKVLVRGDESTPMRKVGEVTGGILNLPEAIIIPLKSRWWKFWEDVRFLIVEGEFITDLFEGEVVIEASGIDPLTDKFLFVNVSQGYGNEDDRYTDAEVQLKRSKLMEKIFARLGAFDMNDDIWENTKTSARGGRAAARKEYFWDSRPPVKTEDEMQKEQQIQEQRMMREEMAQSHGMQGMRKQQMPINKRRF